jgi:hypothetical protein
MFVRDPRLLDFSEPQETAFPTLITFLYLVSSLEQVREAVEMVSGNAWSCFHAEHMVNSFTPLVQASADCNTPCPNLSKASKNTHFLNLLEFLYMSITSSSFWRSFMVTIFHIGTKT